MKWKILHTQKLHLIQSIIHTRRKVTNNPLRISQPSLLDFEIWKNNLKLFLSPCIYYSLQKIKRVVKMLCPASLKNRTKGIPRVIMKNGVSRDRMVTGCDNVFQFLCSLKGHRVIHSILVRYGTHRFSLHFCRVLMRS